MPQNQRLSEEEFDLWMGHPVTQRLMAFLRYGIEGVKEDFIRGSLIMDDQWKTGMKQANVVGRCEMAQTILEVDFQLLEKFDEE